VAAILITYPGRQGT